MSDSLFLQYPRNFSYYLFICQKFRLKIEEEKFETFLSPGAQYV